jgi:hypothetical protein
VSLTGIFPYSVRSQKPGRTNKKARKLSSGPFF